MLIMVWICMISCFLQVRGEPVYYCVWWVGRWKDGLGQVCDAILCDSLWCGGRDPDWEAGLGIKSHHGGMDHIFQWLLIAIVSKFNLSHPILSYRIISYPIQSYLILSYSMPCYPILSYPILIYPVLSYPILSCRMLS